MPFCARPLCAADCFRAYAPPFALPIASVPVLHICAAVAAFIYSRSAALSRRIFRITAQGKHGTNHTPFSVRNTR